MIGFSFGAGRASKMASSVLDPTTLSLSGYWRGSYAGSPWVGTASAGSSGGRNLTEATNAPSVGAALNSLASADYDGTDDQLAASGVVASDLIATGGYRVSFLAEFDALPAPAGAVYSNPSVIMDTGTGNFGVVVNNAGVHAYHSDGSFKTASSAAAISTGTKYAIDVVYDGTNITVSVNGTAGTPVAAGNAVSITGAVSFGRNVFNDARLNGRIWDLYTAQTDLAAVTSAAHKAYINSRYALAL